MKEVGVQTQSGDSAGPRVFSKTPIPEFEFPQILYSSHTVLWLLIAVGILGYFTFLRDDSDSLLNQRQGFLGLILVFIFTCGVQLPDSGFFSRPHPVFWRMLQGVGLCYFTMLVYLLFQNLDDSRQLLTFLDPKLGKSLPDKNYADDCRIYTPEHPESIFYNIKDCFFDIYIPAHALGWFFKMIIIRDMKLCWILSVFFEFLELTLKFQIPNFAECWWDSLIFDIILCNGGGIYLGYLTCRFFQMKEFFWGIGEDKRSATGRFSALSRTASQLTPHSWLSFNWEMFGSCKNFITTIWLVIFVSATDLSNFYLKFILWIPADHWILVIRVFFVAFYAMVSIEEYFEYVSSGFRLRLGTNSWLAHMTVFTEWMIILKHSQGMFVEPMPYWLQIAWTGIGCFVVSSALCLFYSDISKKNSDKVKSVQ
ncbi:unnamed protein product [Blepharisma stoltei]|uniref:L-serine-phosphatidylethanolamine phosphatidyltransferase n=1 Tax=Blepharisma stoltei TaxID=1481888 RepID=A0AAU9I805_9CILI|nr:unnamed protein product [Blepharisma stoltei]